MITITDPTTGVVHQSFSLACAKCHKPVLIPEPYYAWYRRTLGIEPSYILCGSAECKGKVYDDDLSVPEWWSEAPIAPWNNVSLHDDTTKHETHTYYGNSFWSAHKALKAFIKDTSDGQSETEHGIVGSSIDHGPQIHKVGFTR